MEYAVVSWVAESTQSQRQARAQIIVALDSDMQQVIYTSNLQEAHDSTGTRLPVALQPRTAYYWTVQVWGDQGDTAVSAVNMFETGKREEPLQGEWITTPWDDRNISPYVTKRFCAEKPVRKARLYLSGLGLYLLEANGKQVCDTLFAPGCTSSDRWVQVYTHDVTEYLQEGENVLGLLMGNGWAKGRFGNYPPLHSPYIDRYLLKAELRLTYADGTEQVIVTDTSWRCAPSPVLDDNLYDGEIYDARNEIPNWSDPSCRTDLWEPMVQAGDVQLGALEDRRSLPVLVKETVKPVELLQAPSGEWILDLGQNIAGWVRMRVHEPAGTRLTLRFGEILQKGKVYQGNLGSAKAEYVYISDGSNREVEPHFTFYGFRYASLEGFTEPPVLEDFTGCVVYSDLWETGWLTTSNEQVNRLYANAKWSQKDNFLDVPTDCPQRDECMGWTADAQVFCKTASYNMETYAFFSKFLHDLWREQEKNHGMVSHVVPSFLKEPSDESSFWGGGSCAWGDAAVIMPWILYQHYGDRTILETQYPSMKAWIGWVLRKGVDENGLWTKGFHFGDWMALDGQGNDDRLGGTDISYIASAYLAYSSGLVAETARVLGQDEDALFYQQLCNRTKRMIQKNYFDENGTCLIPTQTAHILALAFDLIEPGQRASLAADLVRLLNEKNMHLQTGFVGTPFICKVLSQAGYSREAYQIFLNEDYPSWLYEVSVGATTIWERWNAVNPDGSVLEPGDNSLNHYTYGSIVQWMYENIGGLTLKEAGFKTFSVRPEFTDRLSFAELQFDSPKGWIRIKWERTAENRYVLHVQVPFDTTAELQLPGQASRTLPAGTYELAWNAAC